MRARALPALIACALFLGLPLSAAAEELPETTPDAAPITGYVALEQVIEAADLGLAAPSGVSFVPETGELLVVGSDASGNPTLANVTPVGQVNAIEPAPAGVAENAPAYDAVNDRLVAPSDAGLVTVDAPGGDISGPPSDVPVTDAAADAAGVAIDAGGKAVVLGADATLRTVDTDGASPVVSQEVPLTGASEPLTGLAVAADASVYSIATSGTTLYQFAPDGTLAVTRDLAGIGIDAPTGLVLAPSADTSDAPSETSLYVADAGSTGTDAAVYELALAEPRLDESAITAAVSSVTLVNTFQTGAGSAWNPDSPDPSGLAYIPATETEVPAARRDRLVAADGEVEETTGAGWHNVNIWFAPRNGSAQTATFNTDAAPTNPLNPEPVGAAYDTVRNELYICEDGSDSRVWVYNAVTMAQVRTFDVSVAPYNNVDCEGVGFGNGTLYMVDAIDNDLVKVTGGGDGVVGSGTDVVTNYDLDQYGQAEPEGLDVHPVTGNIWIVSNRLRQGVPEPMIEVTPTGALVSSVSIAAANPESAGGLAIAPTSTGGGGWSAYIVDRGIDNADNPNENDGFAYEFSLGGAAPAGPDTTITGGPQGTVSSTDASFTFTGTNHTSFECRLDAAAFGPCTSPASYTGVAEGSHTFEVRAMNGTTADPTPAARTWTVDTAVPPPPPPGNLLANWSFELDANGNSIPDNWGSNSRFTRSNATAARDGAWVGRHLNNNGVIFQQVAVTAGTTYDFSGMVNLPTTSDAFSFQLNVQWRAGSSNLGAPVVIHNFTDDTAGAWVTATGSVTAPSGATAARVQMDGNSMNTTGTAYVDAFFFGAGSPPPQPLDTSITGGPSGSTTETSATFTFTGTGHASFECQLDAGAWEACTSPKTYGPLALGSHTFAVRAVDGGGTPDATPASRTWTIVETAPPSDNLLTNGGFELDADGNTIPDGWGTKDKFTRSSAVAAQEGAFVGRHLATNDSGYSIFQEVPITAGTTYAFGGWVNIPTTSDAFTFSVRVKWMNGTTAVRTTTIRSFTASTAGWQELASNLVAPSGATSARVMMVVSSLNGTIYADDFSFAAAP